MKWIDTTKKFYRFMVVIAIFTAVIGLWRCLSYVPRLPAEYRVFYYNQEENFSVCNASGWVLGTVKANKLERWLKLGGANGIRSIRE